MGEKMMRVLLAEEIGGRDLFTTSRAGECSIEIPYKLSSVRIKLDCEYGDSTVLCHDRSSIGYGGTTDQWDRHVLAFRAYLGLVLNLFLAIVHFHNHSQQDLSLT